MTDTARPFTAAYDAVGTALADFSPVEEAHEDGLIGSCEAAVIDKKDGTAQRVWLYGMTLATTGISHAVPCGGVNGRGMAVQFLTVCGGRPPSPPSGFLPGGSPSSGCPSPVGGVSYTSHRLSARRAAPAADGSHSDEGEGAHGDHPADEHT